MTKPYAPADLTRVDHPLVFLIVALYPKIPGFTYWPNDVKTSLDLMRFFSGINGNDVLPSTVEAWSDEIVHRAIYDRKMLVLIRFCQNRFGDENSCIGCNRTSRLKDQGEITPSQPRFD